MMAIAQQKTVIFMKEPVNGINRTATLIKIEEDLYRVNNQPNGTKNEMWNGTMLSRFLSNNEIVLI